MENFYRNKDQNWSIFQEQKTFKPGKKKKKEAKFIALY